MIQIAGLSEKLGWTPGCPLSPVSGTLSPRVAAHFFPVEMSAFFTPVGGALISQHLPGQRGRADDVPRKLLPQAAPPSKLRYLPISLLIPLLPGHFLALALQKLSSPGGAGAPLEGQPVSRWEEGRKETHLSLVCADPI